MAFPRLIIAGSHSGVGKSTVSLGLMAALKQRGLTVQAFKVGPDYIDGSYHTAITGRISRNLDSWMLKEDTVKDVFTTAAESADISIIEGVMGLYDGKGPLSDEGSTAEMSLLLQCPVVLVVDCSGMARSAAAVVKGYQTLDSRVNIAGVIANRVGGAGHYGLIQQAVENACGIPVVGYLTEHPEIEIPERHLGLVPAIERGDHAFMVQELGKMAAATIDIEAIRTLANAAPEIQIRSSLSALSSSMSTRSRSKVKIAVARDAAFNFYYQENLELLERAGAELQFFSPLAGEQLPKNVDGLYIGGGFPEEFAETLSANKQTAEGLQRAIRGGLPTYAECGGYMYLAEELVDRRGHFHAMVGVIPARVTMQERLSGFGYREVVGTSGNWLIRSNQTARGHEFHYSTIDYKQPREVAYELLGTPYLGTQSEGYCRDNVIAGYTHIHFGSNPQIAVQFVGRCAMYREANSRG